MRAPAPLRRRGTCAAALPCGGQQRRLRTAAGSWRPRHARVRGTTWSRRRPPCSWCRGRPGGCGRRGGTGGGCSVARTPLAPLAAAALTGPVTLQCCHGSRRRVRGCCRPRCAWLSRCPQLRSGLTRCRGPTSRRLRRGGVHLCRRRRAAAPRATRRPCSPPTAPARARAAARAAAPAAACAPAAAAPLQRRGRPTAAAASAGAVRCLPRAPPPAACWPHHARARSRTSCPSRRACSTARTAAWNDNARAWSAPY